MSDRLHELRAGLARVEERIARACGDAGRDPADVQLVVVTKTFPASDVRLLAELGVTDVAENKQQELAHKVAELGDDLDVRWHFIGHLQSNKAGAVADDADVVHSVDRLKLVALDGSPADARSRCCCRSASTRPGATTGPGPASTRWRAWRTPSSPPP